MRRDLRRYLGTRGEMGEMPGWYPQMRAARYLQVPPWELEDAPIEWYYRALCAEGAEIEADEIAAEYQKGKRKRS